MSDCVLWIEELWFEYFWWVVFGTKRELKMKLEVVWRKSRGMMTTVDLPTRRVVPSESYTSSFLTLIPTSLLQTICDDAKNRYDKSSETLRFHDRAARSLYCGSSIPRAKKRPQKWILRRLDDLHKAWYYQVNGDQKAEKEKEREINDLKIAWDETQPSFTVIGSLRW